MVVLTTEWLPWLQSRCGDSGYELILVPEGCISNLSPNHTLQLHEHLWESHYNHTSKRWCFWQKLVTLSQTFSGQSARSWLLLHTIRCNHFTYICSTVTNCKMAVERLYSLGRLPSSFCSACMYSTINGQNTVQSTWSQLFNSLWKQVCHFVTSETHCENKFVILLQVGFSSVFHLLPRASPLNVPALAMKS